MELNEKMIGEIAEQLGISSGKNMGKEAMDRLASKSDAELEREILKIKKQLNANNVTYDKQLAMLRNIAPMMDARQRARLQRVIDEVFYKFLLTNSCNRAWENSLDSLEQSLVKVLIYTESKKP